MDQLFIALTGGVAIWLTQQSRGDWKKYACLFGLVGQPFWFYSAYTAEQWGIFALTVLYTYSWCVGFYNSWIKRIESKVSRMAVGTLSLLVSRMDGGNWPAEGSLSKAHIRSLLTQVAEGDVTGEKAHRWLGWSQAAIVAAGVSSMEEMRHVNERA